MSNKNTTIQRLKFTNSTGYKDIINFVVPSICPHCGVISSPNCSSNSIFNSDDDLSLAFLFRCISCHNYFAVGYKFDKSKGVFNLINYNYSIVAKFPYPENILKVSPSFKDIYTQSLTAEMNGLDQIAGVGYRKSIEFIVKDYLKNIQNEDASSKPLGKAINCIKNENIKNVALAGTWIGNDETHYTRKFEDRDINDMKQFLDALAYYVSSEQSALDALQMLKANSK